MMKKIHLSILFSLLIGLSSCSQDDPLEPRVPTAQEQQLLENCRIVQTAAEQFAAINGGHYPIDSTDLTPDSLTLIDLLPGGQLLENPYSGERTSPVSGGANNPGDVGYIGFRCDATIGSYAITGVGQTAGERYVTIRKTCTGEVIEWNTAYTPKLDDLVIENCFVVQAAVEAYIAGNNGVVPPNRTTPNLEGNTLIDLLPNGEYLVNPVTQNATEPSRYGGPRNTGEIAYSVLRVYDSNLGQEVVLGYFLVARGDHRDFTLSNAQQRLLSMELDVIENCLLVRDAAEAFAADNNGVYSNGLADETPAGMILIDYLPEGRLLINPITGMHTEPVVGSPAAQGSTGYLSSDGDSDGAMDAYMIGGVGASYYEIYVIQYPPE
jgi:hypothetical protein